MMLVQVWILKFFSYFIDVLLNFQWEKYSKFNTSRVLGLKIKKSLS
jgi:hypothetical protein